MVKLVLAGACSIYDLSGMKKAFEKSGFQVSFVDAPFMAGIKIHEYPEKEEILYTAEVSDDCVAVPLSEYWISFCKKKGCCRISDRALESSRSKRYFYDFLKKNGFDYPAEYKRVEDAEKTLDEGKRVIVKPEGLHSGYGIEILDKSGKEKLREYVSQAENIKNRTLRLMEIENKGAMLTEAVEGTEYSADCFFIEGRISVVRICRKKIMVINDKPCAAAYVLLSPENEEYKRFEKYLMAWTSAIFDASDISFAQYDFIVSEDGRVVPVDFASRVGGGISDLLMETGKNPYALAVEGEKFQVEEGWTQFHYLPVVSGYITNDDYPLLEGRSHVFKKKGGYVISNPSSVGSRVAVTVCRYEKKIDENLLEKLLLDRRYIES